MVNHKVHQINLKLSLLNNFFQYTNSLKVVREEVTIVNVNTDSGILIRDDDHYLTSFSTGQGSHGEWTVTRTTGTWGNSIGVQICVSVTQHEQELGVQL